MKKEVKITEMIFQIKKRNLVVHHLRIGNINIFLIFNLIFKFSSNFRPFFPDTIPKVKVLIVKDHLINTGKIKKNFFKIVSKEII